MSFGKWLNSLTWIEHLVVIFLFAIASYSAHVTMIGLRNLFEKTQKSPYSNEFRSSPFMFFAFAIPYTIILYRIFGSYIVDLLKSIF
ncbi:MAG: hypothetical protein ACE5D0_07595 [Fidelibacterota bacterium]